MLTAMVTAGAVGTQIIRHIFSYIEHYEIKGVLSGVSTIFNENSKIWPSLTQKPMILFSSGQVREANGVNIIHIYNKSENKWILNEYEKTLKMYRKKLRMYENKNDTYAIVGKTSIRLRYDNNNNNKKCYNGWKNIQMSKVWQKNSSVTNYTTSNSASTSKSSIS